MKHLHLFEDYNREPILDGYLKVFKDTYKLQWDLGTKKWNAPSNIKLDPFFKDSEILPILFYNAEGDFDAKGLKKLKFLYGFPRYVGGTLNVQGCPISTLKGSPLCVSGSFDCSFTNIKNFEGGPRIVRGFYKCIIPKIESLNGLPIYIGGRLFLKDDFGSIKGEKEVNDYYKELIESNIGFWDFSKGFTHKGLWEVIKGLLLKREEQDPISFLKIIKGLYYISPDIFYIRAQNLFGKDKIEALIGASEFNLF